MRKRRKNVRKKKLEKLAEIQHDIWSHWMEYLFEQGKMVGGEFFIKESKVLRWKRQMTTDYNNLSDEEKESDRNVIRDFFIRKKQ